MPSFQTVFRAVVMVAVGAVAVKGWHLYGPTNEQVKTVVAQAVEIVQSAIQGRQQATTAASDPRVAAPRAPLDIAPATAPPATPMVQTECAEVAARQRRDAGVGDGVAATGRRSDAGAYGAVATTGRGRYEPGAVGQRREFVSVQLSCAARECAGDDAAFRVGGRGTCGGRGASIGQGRSLASGSAGRGDASLLAGRRQLLHVANE